MIKAVYLLGVVLACANCLCKGNTNQATAVFYTKPCGDNNPCTTHFDPDTAVTGYICGGQLKKCEESRYRSLTGYCNNLQSPYWGASNLPFARLLPFDKAAADESRPDSDLVTRKVFPDRPVYDHIWNLNEMQFGQIVTHDMSLIADPLPTENNVQRCCEENSCGNHNFANTEASYATAHYYLPSDTTYVTSSTQCVILTDQNISDGCVSLNITGITLTNVTAFLDLSVAYGNNEKESRAIRAFEGGRLITEQREGQEWPPTQKEPDDFCAAPSPAERCYLLGDPRGNQSPQLTLLQVILIRNHNRIADILKKLNPHWSDETIYHETRRINAAQYQHIVYYEWLPDIIGFENMIKNKLIYPLSSGYVNDYDPKVNPTMLDEFSTAALRHFHTLVRGHLKMISEDRSLYDVIRLSDWFNRPIILERDDGFDKLARGFTSQKQSFSDQYLTEEITKYLFKGNDTTGLNLRAIDINRGRTGGLPRYPRMRGACGLSVPKSFSDLRKYMSQKNVKALKGLYGKVENIDLMVGGALEFNVLGTQVGATFLCILTEQFYRTRKGDRFFYENGVDKKIAFTLNQLNSIRKASVARLICDNSKNVDEMQRKAFNLVGFLNPLVPCKNIPSIDLTLWKETPKKTTD